MSTSLLYHAFGIRGYHYTRTDYQDGQTIFSIRQEPETCRCSACGSPQVVSRGRVERRFRVVPIGRRATFVVLPIPRVECQACGVVRQGAGKGDVAISNRVLEILGRFHADHLRPQPTHLSRNLSINKNISFYRFRFTVSSFAEFVNK